MSHRERYPWLRPLAISLFVGVHAGLTDLTLSLLSRSSGFTSLSSLYPPLLATGFCFTLLTLVTWYVAAAPVARRGSIPREAAEVWLCTFITASFLLTSMAGLVRWPREPEELFELSFAAAVSALIATAACLAWYELTRSPARRASVVVLLFASPFLWFEVVLLEWCQLYHIGSVFSLASAASFILLGVALVWTYRFVARSGGATRSLAWLTSAFLSLVIGISARQRFSGAVHEPPSGAHHALRRVLLVTSDALRSDALSCYADTSPPSPNIDRLASRGVLFEKAYSSAPWTLASLASVLTGLSPDAHTLTNIKSRLPDEIETVSESLTRSGYHTGAIVLNDLLHPRSNLSQGFEDYVFLTEPSFGASFGAAVLQRTLPSLFPSPPWPRSEDITRIALGWIEAHRDQDFFLWVHYYDPHAPYTPPRRYLSGSEPPPGMGYDFYGQKEVLEGLSIPSRAQRQWIHELYRGEVRYLDDSIGALLQGLERLGLYDDSLIVFSSDHGEEFWDHGAHGHGHTLYNELLSVPLIVKPPRASRPGHRVKVRVPTEAITPTILDLCGIEYQPARFSARSLAPLLESDTGSYVPSPIVSNSSVLFDRKEAVIFGGLKYQRTTIGDAEMLFDLDSDPKEMAPLSSPPPIELAQARALLERHRQACQLLRGHYRIGGQEEVVFDEDTLRKLRDLGYVQ
jgi:arylsulfatase A-like enzyme